MVLSVIFVIQVFFIMTAKSKEEIKRNDKTVYVKPVLTYDQLVEIIDARIAEIEKASKKDEAKRKKKKKK